MAAANNIVKIAGNTVHVEYFEGTDFSLNLFFWEDDLGTVPEIITGHTYSVRIKCADGTIYQKDATIEDGPNGEASIHWDAAAIPSLIPADTPHYWNCKRNDIGNIDPKFHGRVLLVEEFTD